MIELSRTTVIVLVALGATLAGIALASNASRLRGSEEAPDTGVAAGPQTANLGWRETYGPPGEQVVFTVDSLEVTPTGWRARVGVENASSVAWELVPGAIPDGTFGLQLFTTGDLDELEERNSAGTLPAVRAATSYEPVLPKILDPDAAWEGEISANGALVAESWARVVFGTLIAVGKPPDALDETVVWITDEAHRLRR
ncbi:MAG TPA: hypothetical protein VJ745_05990 [Gaiellaceae bacterium]|nr:hypothetical protein [Gaiellaceae bacterium]